MRYAILGIVLAVAFLGALFAAAHYDTRHSSPSSAPAQTVQSLRPGFYGIQRNGAWTLECLKRPRIPVWAERMAAAAAKSDSNGPPPHARPPLCHVITRITRGGPNTAWMDLIFSLTPKGAFLTAVMRLAPDLAAPGDYLTLHLSNSDQRVRVMFCGPTECLAVPVVRPENLAKMKRPLAEDIADSKTAILAFPAASGTEESHFSIPMDGLQTAIAAMRQMNSEPRR